MVKVLLGTLVVVAASLAAWGIITRTHPVFVATEAIEASRKAGVLTEEMSAEVDREDFKSALVTFSIWGAIVGLAIGIASPMSKNKLFIRALAGLVLGAVSGLCAAYISNHYSRFSEPPTDFSTYWLTRWNVVLLPMVAAFGVIATIASWSAKDAVENVVRFGVGVVLAVCTYVFSMGLFTPIEQAQYIFPGFKSNSSLLLVATGVLGYLMLSLRLSKASKTETVEKGEVQVNNAP